jgi:hypothetical protein
MGRVGFDTNLASFIGPEGDLDLTDGQHKLFNLSVLMVRERLQ